MSIRIKGKKTHKLNYIMQIRKCRHENIEYLPELDSNRIYLITAYQADSLQTELTRFLILVFFLRIQFRK